MRVAPQIVLTQDQKQTLQQWARGRSLPARQVERARIVLMAAAGKQDLEIAAGIGISSQKAARWRKRFLQFGLAGLEKDAPGRGRKPTITPGQVQEVIGKTAREKPANATHWSTRTMAEVAGLSEKSVRRIWHKHGLKPHLSRTFKVSNDPEFAEKLEAIVGLYLNPPEHAIVLCADEKSQIQALDRTQPGLPIKKGRCGTMTHDYKRNGTATLFAALNTLDGTVIGMCDDRHRHQEWLRFLKVIDQVTPEGQEIHLIADNYATHKHSKVQKWLGRHARFHVYFTPTSSSWLNMVERFFRDLTQNRLRLGVFRDVEELIMAIGDYIDKHNHRPKPFVWTAKASDILEKVKRARTALNNDLIFRPHYTSPPGTRQGNDKPIVSIVEQWTDPNTGVQLLQTQSGSDGGPTFSMPDYKAGDPDPSLFQVPSDYKIVDETGKFTFTIRRERLSSQLR